MARRVPTDGLLAASALQMSKGRPGKMGLEREEWRMAKGEEGRNTTLGWQQPVEKPTNAIKLRRATEQGEDMVLETPLAPQKWRLRCDQWQGQSQANTSHGKVGSSKTTANSCLGGGG